MRRDKTDEITICSNGVGGSGDKGSRLGRHPKYVYKPLFPPRCLGVKRERERARVCEEFESSPTLE